jgi:hypothetical protein
VKWTFEREAKWMLWVSLIPALFILASLAAAWLRR